MVRSSVNREVHKGEVAGAARRRHGNRLICLQDYDFDDSEVDESWHESCRIEHGIVLITRRYVVYGIYLQKSYSNVLVPLA